MGIQTSARDLSSEFDFLDDWEARYAHIIDLGRANPPLHPNEKTDETRVRGCASQVWMVTEAAPDGTMTLRAESDAVIVSGLIAILTRLYTGATPAEVGQFDAEAFFRDIGVTGALTAQRSNGLASMIARLKSDAMTQT